MSGSWRSLDLGELGESDSTLSILLNVVSLNISRVKLDGLDDVEALVPSRVSTRDLSIKLSDGTTKRDITVLLVHVDIILSSEVLEDNAEVSNTVGFSLKDLRNGDDLTLALSNFVLSLHLVPEVRASNNGVLSEHSDSVAGRIRVLSSGSLSTDNPELSDLNIG